MTNKPAKTELYKAVELLFYIDFQLKRYSCVKCLDKKGQNTIFLRVRGGKKRFEITSKCEIQGIKSHRSSNIKE